MIEQLQEFAGGFPEWAQGLAVALVAMIPFVESYFGAAIGVAIGLHPVVAVGAAVVGNVASMLIFVLGTHATRQRVRQVRGTSDAAETPKRQRLRRMFDRFGVPGVSLLGQTFLPSQITSAAMVGFGASKNAVILWQIVSIALWGTLFGVLALLGVGLLLR
ncbi:hypothetical protein JD276_00870 [Leucobacter sp. CSA1]|uniref:Small multidrug efflux protein n=1 Tax=Leucobacter chromiisoli TaxID=2796471 RepID=A0A934UTD0_9MICO|nr:hypothetical protein [Leucobacter chromiisoli]MBK0417590.1 hypothetical protein [Leucobacter chromiisoli]